MGSGEPLPQGLKPQPKAKAAEPLKKPAYPWNRPQSLTPAHPGTAKRGILEAVAPSAPGTAKRGILEAASGKCYFQHLVFNLTYFFTFFTSD